MRLMRTLRNKAMFQSSPKEESSLEIYILRLTVQSGTDLPLPESLVKVKVGSIHKKTIACSSDGTNVTWNTTLEYYVNKTDFSAQLQVCDKDAFKEVYGETTLSMSSHPLDQEKQHKLRLRGPNGSKLQTSVVVFSRLERTDKRTATKLMKKRAKSFNKKDIKRSFARAKSSMSQFKDKTKEAYSSNLKSTAFFAESTASLGSVTTVAEASSSSVPTTSSSLEDSTNVKVGEVDTEPAKYRLYVQFYEAGNISGKGSKQTFDTYVKLKVNDLEYKTRVVKKNANPKFNESFEFDLHDLSEPLRIRIFQVSRLFDEVLGTCKVRLSVLPFDTDLNINEFPIVTDEARFKCYNPHVSLGIRLSCLASKQLQLNNAASTTSTSNPVDQDNSSAYRVYINMFRGRDLLAFDETGTSDPYVLLRIGSIQHQTDVIYHSLAPMWNDSFLFSINSLEKDLHLTVVDEDPEFDDMMANYRLHLNKIPLRTRCEFEIELENDSGRLEFSMLIQQAEDPVISHIPYISYSDIPIAQLDIKPIGLAQNEKNTAKQNYRLEVCIGKEAYSIFYEGPGQGSWVGIDVYDAYLETVKFNLYMVKFGLQEKLMASIEEDVGNQGSTTNNHVTLDIPEISNMFLLSFNLQFKSYVTGTCMPPVEYDEEKSFEEMTFDELGDALSCPYNYVLCLDSVVFESNGAFGDDKLIAVVEAERIRLKSEPSTIVDNDIHCGFIFRLETMPRSITLKLFKRSDNFSTYLGSCEFNITKGSEGVLKSRMVLETDNSNIQLAVLFDVIQHHHQDIINTMTIPSIPVVRPDADELTLLNNFKKLTYCFITLQLFLKHTTSIRRMGNYKKLLLYVVSMLCVLHVPAQYTELTLPVSMACFILAVSFRIVWKRRRLSEMRLALLEEINTCNVEERIFVRTCDKTVSKINETLQKIIYVFSWNSPVHSTIFLVKLITLASLFVLLPEQIFFLILLLILLSHRTPIETVVNELLNFINPLNGVPANICS